MRGHTQGAGGEVEKATATTPRGPATHELLRLQASAGNAAVITYVQRLGRDRSAPAAPPPGAGGGGTGGRDLDAIERRYREMVQTGRDRMGWTVAADMLQFWLDNRSSSAVQRLDTSWLRSFHAVTSAEGTNESRFEPKLKQRARQLADGESAHFHDHWDRALTPAIFLELYYASGTSEVSSVGDFFLSRRGSTVTVTGTVHHHWHDRYDWNSGQGVYLPGYGGVSDDDALALRRAGRGADFTMVGDWDRTCSGAVDIGVLYDSIDLEWSDGDGGGPPGGPQTAAARPAP